MRILFFLLIAVSFSSCSKYEEGKASLSSKKSRLVNSWDVVSIKANGIDITFLNIITHVDIRDNNTLTVTGIENGVAISRNGSWIFNSNKTSVLVTNSDGSLDSYEIIKLEKDSLKLKIIDDNGNEILHEYKTA